MFNTGLFNTGLFNAAPPSPVSSESTDLIIFDTVSFANAIIITEELEDSGCRRRIMSGNIPRDDGQFITGDYYSERTIIIKGHVVETSAQLLDDRLDTMRKNLRKREANLDVTRLADAANRRRYVATVTNFHSMFKKRRGYDITVCPFEIEFTCKEPFGHDTGYTSVDETVTVNPTNKAANNTGTIHSRPVIILVIDSATSCTSVQVTNLTTGEVISHTPASDYNPGDIVRFDSELKTVTYNGVAADYNGVFPKLDVGQNTFEIAMTGTSFSISATIKHKNAYQ